MASIDPSPISTPQEKEWVVEISKIMHHQLQIDVQTPSISLFQVPKTITATKPEAYEPQQIGLGPIHHFQPQPYKKMEQKKLALMRNILLVNPEIKDSKLTLVLEKVKQLVPVVRSCYDMFLQDDDEQLAWIFAIDGLFLLQLFHTYNIRIEREKEKHRLGLKSKIQEEIKSDDIHSSVAEGHARMAINVEDIDDETIQIDVVVINSNEQVTWEKTFSFPQFHPELPKIGSKKRLVAQDIMMAENQIPFIVLQQIDEAVVSFAGGSSHLSPYSLFHIFCAVHSPLKLCSKRQAPSSADHLLHYMYHSILNNVPAPKPKPKPEVGTGGRVDFIPETRILEHCTFISKIPKDEIVQAYEQTISILETFCESKIIIPSASDLHDKGGFRFHNMEDDHGIQNIRMDGKDIYLPVITLHKDSNVILRNLIAYESLSSNSDSDTNSFPLAEYMIFMCALVVKADDVKRLENVIKGDLSADEVVELFTGMSGSIPAMKMNEESKLQKMTDEINKGYYSTFRMKPYVASKKVAKCLLVVLKAVGGFVGSSWKIVAFVVSLVTVFLLTRQAYCDVYGSCK